MKKLIVVAALGVAAITVRADENMTATPASSESWFQASLTPDIAIHPKTTEINGFAINVWGENPQHSFNLGIVNGSTGDSAGFSLGIVNYDDSYNGFQAGVVNYSKQNFTGLEYGLVNIAEGEFNGWQDGWVNISKGTFVGLQSGYVNVSENFTGLQLGLVNYSQHLHGVQVGLANIAMNNGWFDDMPDKFAKGFVIVNWSF